MPKIPTFESQGRPTAEVGGVKSNVQMPFQTNLTQIGSAIEDYYVKERKLEAVNQAYALLSDMYVDQKDANGNIVQKGLFTIQSETKANGDDLTHFRIDASPIAGLTVGADYSTVSGTLATTRYKQESAGAYAKYVAGPLTVGFSRTGYQPTVVKTTATGSLSYETDAYGIKFAVNENLTISYGEEKSTKRTSSTLAETTGARTAASEVDYEIEHIQAAYVIGGATLGVAIADGKNVAYTPGRQDKQTIFSLAMAF